MFFAGLKHRILQKDIIINNTLRFLGKQEQIRKGGQNVDWCNFGRYDWRAV